MVTVFRLIRPGALHRANGGYLILQARDADPSRWADGRDEADVTATNGRLILHAVS